MQPPWRALDTSSTIRMILHAGQMQESRKSLSWVFGAILDLVYCSISHTVMEAPRHQSVAAGTFHRLNFAGEVPYT